MLTFVESRPEEHPTKRTTFVRLDDECKITIGVEDGTAPRVDTHYNFSGLVTDYEPPKSETNIAYVHAHSDPDPNGVQTCHIAVRMYHNADATGENLPLAGYYDYKAGTGWRLWRSGELEDRGTEHQEFPVVLWDTTDITRAGSLPGENTEPSLITDAMIREQRDAKAISEGRGINHYREYSNRDDFLNHLGEVCNEREYFFRGEPKHYKPEPLSTDVITSRLSREVSHDFENVVKYSLDVESHGILYRHSPVPGLSSQYEADFRRSLFKRQIEELSIAKSSSLRLLDDNSYRLASDDEVRGLPQNVEEANFCQEDRQLLAEIQHYGGSTILIDFTRNRDVALFFACKDKLDEDGRLMLLPKEREGKMWNRISPSKSFTRYRKQESVLVVPRLGCLFPNGNTSPTENDDIQCVMFNIPKELKQDILEHLENLPRESVTHKSLDIHGGCERIPDKIRGYIEGQKSRVQKTFIRRTRYTSPPYLIAQV